MLIIRRHAQQILYCNPVSGDCELSVKRSLGRRRGDGRGFNITIIVKEISCVVVNLTEVYQKLF